MEWPLLDLFYQLREEGLPLSSEQYYCCVDYLLQSIEQDAALATNIPKIKRICQTLWVKSKRQEQLFNKAWEQMRRQSQQDAENAIAVHERQKTEQQAIAPVTETRSVDPIRATPEPSQPATLPSIPQTSQVATALQWQRPPRLKPKDRSDYYPIGRTQLEASWQQLHPSPVPSTRRQPDLVATVQDVAKRGFFTDFRYQPLPKNRRQVNLLIDRSESMIPFAGFGRLLAHYWLEAKVYYFENIVTDDLYLDEIGWDTLPITDILSQSPSEQTIWVIWSDAGAARRRDVPERYDATKRFLGQLSRRSSRVAWLNPLPSQRWFDNTAIDIADLGDDLPQFRMFSLEDEFETMTAWLKSPENAKSSFYRGVEGSFPPEIEDEAYFSLDAASRLQVFKLDYKRNYSRFQPEIIALTQAAAFPLGLTPELLYYLRQKQKNSPPWYAIADLLLSSLVHRVDRDLYEMDKEVRQLLLAELDPQQKQELAHRLQSYIQSQLNSRSGQQRIYAETQQWTALAYTQPGEAARQLRQAMAEAMKEENRIRLVRLAAITETLADALADYQPLLLSMAEAVAAYARGDNQTGSNRVNLPLMDAPALKEVLIEELEREPFPPLQEFEFTTTLLTLEETEPLQLIQFETATLEIQRQGRRQPKIVINKAEGEGWGYGEPLSETLALEMMQIPAGSFLMGSPENEPERRDTESPQHEVRVEEFFMGKYPITQAQWRVVAALPQIERSLDPDPSSFEGEDRPVEQVSWLEAKEFCGRLSQLSQKQYRLPTEAEWEYACRAGTTTPFYFGETITPELANYDWKQSYNKIEVTKEKDFRGTTPVGSFLANGFGLYDMHGNVREWCEDHWHSNYEGAPRDGSAWLNLEEKKPNYVRRGGSWFIDPRNCRSASRNYGTAGVRFSNFGFRVVCAASRTQ